MTSRGEITRLQPDQRKALEHIRRLASRTRLKARDDIRSVLRRTELSQAIYDDAMESLRAHARVALHFHPERLSRTGRTVADGLLESGIYRNQFETGLSSGSPSAFPGGERDQWERRLFNGAYHVTRSPAASRPKYGALEVMYHPDGPAPRFGSCYFLLRPQVSRRSTFTFGGSQEPEAPERTGTLEILEPVLGPLLAQVERGEGAFSVGNLTVANLLSQLTVGLSEPFRPPGARPLGRALDSFIEAQVHGDVWLNGDAECLVADPAFRRHPIGDVLAAIASKYELPLDWHPGFTLPVDEVPDDFRDYPVRPLAERIAGRGTLDAANIGAAANSVELDPEAWRSWASYGDTLTQFRRLWHVLVLYGAPNDSRHADAAEPRC